MKKNGLAAFVRTSEAFFFLGDGTSEDGFLKKRGTWPLTKWVFGCFWIFESVFLIVAGREFLSCRAGVFLPWLAQDCFASETPVSHDLWKTGVSGRPSGVSGPGSISLLRSGKAQ